MAMTKKERAEFDAAITKANLLAALRWTEEVKKDVPAPGYDDKETSGWDFNISTRTVFEEWSGSVTHGRMPKNKAFASQDSKSLFSTKLLALRAMRHSIEKEVAWRLLAVDKLIAAELENLK